MNKNELVGRGNRKRKERNSGFGEPHARGEPGPRTEF